jgi:hypothetical protein
MQLGIPRPLHLPSPILRWTCAPARFPPTPRPPFSANRRRPAFELLLPSQAHSHCVPFGSRGSGQGLRLRRAAAAQARGTARLRRCANQPTPAFLPAYQATPASRPSLLPPLLPSRYPLAPVFPCFWPAAAEGTINDRRGWPSGPVEATRYSRLISYGDGFWPLWTGRHRRLAAAPAAVRGRCPHPTTRVVGTAGPCGRRRGVDEAGVMLLVYAWLLGPALRIGPGERGAPGLRLALAAGGDGTPILGRGGVSSAWAAALLRGARRALGRGSGLASGAAAMRLLCRPAGLS